MTPIQQEAREAFVKVCNGINDGSIVFNKWEKEIKALFDTYLEKAYQKGKEDGMTEEENKILGVKNHMTLVLPEYLKAFIQQAISHSLEARNEEVKRIVEAMSRCTECNGTGKKYCNIPGCSINHGCIPCYATGELQISRDALLSTLSHKEK